MTKGRRKTAGAPKQVETLTHTEAKRKNIPTAEVRKNARQSIGHTSADQPIIADGHQTELYHPGVWAKRILAQVVAGRMDASALHLAVDSDAPKHLYLRWPGVSLPITDDPELSRAHWSGL